MKLADSFGIVLKRLRKEKGISQTALAKNCQLDRTFISLLERGQRQPSLSTIFVIAEKLQITPTDFVSKIDQQMRRSRWARHAF